MKSSVQEEQKSLDVAGQPEPAVEEVPEEVQITPAMVMANFLSRLSEYEAIAKHEENMLKKKIGSLYTECDFKAMGLTNKEGRDGHVNQVVHDRRQYVTALQTRANHMKRMYETLIELGENYIDLEFLLNPYHEQVDLNIEALKKKVYKDEVAGVFNGRKAGNEESEAGIGAVEIEGNH